LPALLASGHFEVDRLAFREAAESVRLNCTEVHKNILAILAGDEAVTLRVIKLFPRSGFGSARLVPKYIPTSRQEPFVRKIELLTTEL
jgi:hypothetical protein